MSGDPRSRPARPAPFWIVATFAVLWNLLGLAQFLLQITASPPAEQAPIEDVPASVEVVFGVAVGAGLLGSVLLLLGRREALPMLVVSAAAVAVQTAYTVFGSDTFAVHGAAGLGLPVVLLVIAVALVAVARVSIARDWIR